MADGDMRRIVEANAKVEYKTPFRHLEPELPEAARVALARTLARGEQSPLQVFVDTDGNILLGHAVYDILGDRITPKVVGGLGDLEREAFILRKSYPRPDLTAADRALVRQHQRALAIRMRERDPVAYKQQTIADWLGVGRQTVTDWLGNHRPPKAPPPPAESGQVKAELVGEGRATRIANRTEVHQQVREMSAAKVPLREIAKRLGIGSGTVSSIRKRLGIAGSAPAEKLWGDIEHIATTLEGVTMTIATKIEELERIELEADEREIKSCKRSLSKSNREITALVAALRERL